MTRSSVVRCGSASNSFRSFGAEHKMKDRIVFVARTRNQGEVPLEGEDARVRWKTFGRLLV
jgi:hypothetical protein